MTMGEYSIILISNIILIWVNSFIKQIWCTVFIKYALLFIFGKLPSIGSHAHAITTTDYFSLDYDVFISYILLQSWIPIFFYHVLWSADSDVT